jgi:hypothetical protein
MKSVIELLGDDSAKIWCVYARHNSWAGLASTSRVAHEKGPACSNSACSHNLLYWAGGLNSWEACCRFQGKWWMGGTGGFKDHPLEVLRHVTNPNTANGQHQCYRCDTGVPVSYPASTGGNIPNKPYPTNVGLENY